MPETSDTGLSFPQRHWLLLCVLVALLSPLIVHLISSAAHKESARETMEQKHVNGGTGGSSPAGGAVPPGDSARPGSIMKGNPTNNNELKDTSYRVAAPPQHR